MYVHWGTLCQHCATVRAWPLVSAHSVCNGPHLHLLHNAYIRSKNVVHNANIMFLHNACTMFQHNVCIMFEPNVCIMFAQIEPLKKHYVNLM